MAMLIPNLAKRTNMEMSAPLSNCSYQTRGIAPQRETAKPIKKVHLGVSCTKKAPTMAWAKISETPDVVKFR